MLEHGATFQLSGGQLEVPDRPGIGLSPIPERIEEFATYRETVLASHSDA